MQRLRNVDLPAPLEPKIPILLDGPMLKSSGFIIVFLSNTTLAFFISITFLPNLDTEERLSSTFLRKGGSSAIKSFALSTLKRGFVERAGAPRESQANSRRNTLRRLAAKTLDCLSRSMR